MKIYLLIGIPNSIFITPHTDFHIVAIMMFTNLSHNRVSLLLKILQQFPISIQSKIQSSYYGLQGLLEAPATSLTSSPLPFLPAYHPPNSPTSQLISKRPDVHSGVFALKVLSITFSPKRTHIPHFFRSLLQSQFHLVNVLLQSLTLLYSSVKLLLLDMFYVCLFGYGLSLLIRI